jgi:hypothetical protein
MQLDSTNPSIVRAKQHFDIIADRILAPKSEELGRALSMEEVNRAISAYATNLDLSDLELDNIFEIKFDEMAKAGPMPRHNASW